MKSFVLFFSGTAALIVSACASYDHKAVRYEDPQSFSHAVEHNGVSIVADAVDTEAEAIATFDEPVTKEGFYPVKIVLSNKSDDRVLVLRDTVRLRGADGQVHHPVSAVVMAEAVEDNAIAYALLGFGIFSYASATEANEERTADYQRKELKEAKVIQPGRQHGAFVYFQLPAGTDVNASVLLLDVQHVGTGALSSFEVPVSAAAAGAGAVSSSASASAPQTTRAPPAEEETVEQARASQGTSAPGSSYAQWDGRWVGEADGWNIEMAIDRGRLSGRVRSAKCRPCPVYGDIDLHGIVDARVPTPGHHGVLHLKGQMPSLALSSRLKTSQTRIVFQPGAP